MRADTRIRGVGCEIDPREAHEMPYRQLELAPPAHWMRITTIDMHTGGEPLRVITSGLPPIEGATVREKRRYFRAHYDHLRTGLMREPRGHADMYGRVVTPSADADFDVFFLHNEGYSTMCGHAIFTLENLILPTSGDTRLSVAINQVAPRPAKITVRISRRLPEGSLQVALLGRAK